MPAAVLERITDAFFALDRDWRFTYVNRRAEPLLGRAPEDLVGRDLWATFPEAVGTTFWSEYHRAVRDGTPVVFTEFYAPLGRWFEVHAYPGVDGLSVYFRDASAQRATHEALERSRADLQLALDAGRLGTWEWDVASGRVLWSAQEEALYGIPAGSFEGTAEAYAARIHPDDRAEAWRLVEAAVAARAEAHHVLHRVVRPDGAVRWLESHGRFVYDADGRPLRLVGVSADVTERVLFARLRERQADMLGAVEVGVWYCDLPFDELRWDRKVKEHFWLPPDARVTIETFYARIHPEDRERTRAAIEHSITAHAPYDIEYRTVAPERAPDAGAVRWIRAIGYTAYDRAGNPARFDGITVDVTAQKRIAEALAASEGRYEYAARATSNAIWDWDLTTDRVTWNPGVHAVFGYADGAVEETAAWWYEHIHPDDRARVVAGIHAVIDGAGGGHAWRDEYRFRRADGTHATVTDRGYVARDAGGRAVRMIGAMEDVTARREAEAAAERTRVQLEEQQLELELVNQQLQENAAELEAQTEELQVTATHLEEQVEAADRAAAALRASEAKYRALFDTMDQGFCLVEVLLDEAGAPADYRFLEVNPAFARQTGLVDAVGHSARALVPGLEQHWVDLYGRVALTGEPAHFEQGSDAMGRWFDVFAFRIGAPEDRRVAILFTDVSAPKAAVRERERLLAEARESEARFRNVADAAPVMLWVTEADGRCTFLNREWLEFTGQTLASGLGFGWLDAVHPDDAAEAERAFRDATARGAPFRVEYRLRRREGEYRRAIDAAAPRLGPAGTFLGYVGSVVDIEERARLLDAAQAARAEAETARSSAEEANRAKSAFLANMSHELRTPLNAIGGYAELLDMGLHGPVTTAQRDALARMRKAQQHLLGLITDVLNYAKLEGGRVEYDVRTVDLRDVVRDVAPLIEPQLAAKGLRFDVRLPDGPCLVRADREKLGQVLVNLLSNAAKFTDSTARLAGDDASDVAVDVVEGDAGSESDGGDVPVLRAPDVTVSVATRASGPGPRGPDAGHPDVVFLRVSDTGRGIARDQQEAIFEPFVQVGKRFAGESAGTGLGLAISRDLARGMGGDLRVRSVEGQGSTFTIALPRVKTTPPAVPDGPAAAPRARL